MNQKRKKSYKVPSTILKTVHTFVFAITPTSLTLSDTGPGLTVIPISTAILLA